MELIGNAREADNMNRAGMCAEAAEGVAGAEGVEDLDEARLAARSEKSAIAAKGGRVGDVREGSEGGVGLGGERRAVEETHGSRRGGGEVKRRIGGEIKRGYRKDEARGELGVLEGAPKLGFGGEGVSFTGRGLTS